MDQQSFTYDAGTLFCTCCSTTVSFYHAAQHVKTRRDLLDAEREHTTAVLVLQEATRVKDKNITELGPTTVEHFSSMAFECVQGAFDYFDHLYLKPHGDMYRLNIAFRGARVFNPIFVKELDVNANSLSIDDLAYFGIQKFTGQFLEGMKSELSLLLDHSRRPFDWSAVPGAADFDSAVLRADAGADVAVAWTQNPGEKARRIWEWWRARLVKNDVFTFFKLAIRLVVLVQASSAAVERANSRLKRIFDVLGENASADLIAYRQFRALNH